MLTVKMDRLSKQAFAIYGQTRVKMQKRMLRPKESSDRGIFMCIAVGLAVHPVLWKGWMNMGKRIRCAKAWLVEHAYLVTLSAVIAVIAASAIYTREFRAVQEENVAAAADAPETVNTAQDEVAEVTPAITPLPTIAPLQVHYARLNPSAGTVWPVEGEIIRAYEAQNLVYWEALDSYSVHLGVDIAGEAGQAVRCAADGVVASVVRDELWGWRLTVDQTDGRQAIYAGIETADVLQGQAVTRGQTLGMLLGKIPCEAEMGAHLHMELYRDGKPQDPEGILPER